MTWLDAGHTTPPRSARVTVACIVGAVAGAVALWLREGGRSNFSDFDQVWIAATSAFAGHDPYSAIQSVFGWPLYYPMTAAVVAAPFTILRIEWAHAAWVAISFGLLGWGLSRRGLWRIIGLLSYPALSAIELGQWSPILTAAALTPALAWLALAKPTTGFAVLATSVPEMLRPRILATIFLMGSVVSLASFVLWSPWLREWIDSVGNAHHFIPLVFRPGGAILLAALVRWRRRDARLLLLLAIVPQTAFAYEALPLVLVVATLREALVFGTLSFCAVPFIAQPNGASEFPSAFAHNAPILLLTAYLPALVMVLRRPNEGGQPEWLERAALRLPHWLRGVPAGVVTSTPERPSRNDDAHSTAGVP